MQFPTTQMMSSVRFLEFQYRLSAKRRNLLRKPPSWLLSVGNKPKSVPLLPVFQIDMTEMKRVFDKFDRNKDGRISREEYKVVLRAIERPNSTGSEDEEWAEQEVSKLFKATDLNRDGCIDFKEFVEAQSKEGGVRITDIRNAFRAFDEDGDGKISAYEVMNMLRRLGESCNLEDCKRMVRAADADGDGVIDIGDFTAMMTRSCNNTYF